MAVHLNELSSVYLDQIVEKKKEKTLDPVGQEDGDIDNDGDEDESDSYLANRRKAIGKAMGKKDKQKKGKKECDEQVEAVDEAKKASLKQARKNIGMDPNKPSCWTGYKAKGTKMKNGRSVPNCVKASHEPEGDLVDEAKKSKMKKARENVGASTCWDGYVAKGTKKKNGRDVPNCVPEGYSDWRSELTETLGEGILIEVEKKKSLKNNSEKITDGPVDNSSIIKINPDFKEGIECLGGTIVEFTEVSERRDDTYLEPNLKKRQKNNEKAIKDMKKMGTPMKNPHFENGPTGSMASEEKDKKAPTPQQRLNRDAGKMASKKLKQKEHEKYVNFLQHDEEVQWVANTAAEYFIEEGLNEDGIEILIEELGLESFVEYVYELGEEVLTEARAGGVRVEPVTKTGKSVGSLRGGARTSAIKRLRKEKQARRDSESGSSKPSGMTAALKSQSDRVKAVDTAKKQQPKKRGLLDRVGDAVVKGIERHNKAMATAKKLSNETGKTLKKAGKVAGAVAKGAGEGVKMAGNAAKVAHKVATEEVEVDMRLRLKERLKAVYEVASPYIVDEGYRVVSKSYKHGDGKPEDDVTIKREKKVVSGDNLTRKGANQSKERRGREYGNQDAFAVQKTREAKKRPSNAPSADKVKADINKKEKQREKTSYNRKIGGMNRAGTASGKVAAARLKGMKKIDAMEKVEFNHPINPDNHNVRKNERNSKIARAGDVRATNADTIARKRGQVIMPSFPNKKKVTEEMSVKDAMAFTIKHNKENPRKEWKPGDHQRARAAQLRAAAKNQKKDTRTDAEKLADAYASPRKGPGGQVRAD